MNFRLIVTIGQVQPYFKFFSHLSPGDIPNCMSNRDGIKTGDTREDVFVAKQN